MNARTSTMLMKPEPQVAVRHARQRTVLVGVSDYLTTANRPATAHPVAPADEHPVERAHHRRAEGRPQSLSEALGDLLDSRSRSGMFDEGWGLG